MTLRSRQAAEIQKTLLGFIQDRLVDSRVYIHFTRDQSISEEILRAGFRYTESFDKTTAEISGSKVDIIYKYQLYKEYGSYLVVICIPLSRFVGHGSRPVNTRHDTLYNLDISAYFPEEELEYLLPPEYVCGYIDIQKNRIHKNMQYLFL
jgi:hypothetical protein